MEAGGDLVGNLNIPNTGVTTSGTAGFAVLPYSTDGTLTFTGLPSTLTFGSGGYLTTPTGYTPTLSPETAPASQFNLTLNNIIVTGPSSAGGTGQISAINMPYGNLYFTVNNETSIGSDASQSYWSGSTAGTSPYSAIFLNCAFPDCANNTTPTGYGDGLLTVMTTGPGGTSGNGTLYLYNNQNQMSTGTSNMINAGGSYAVGGSAIATTGGVTILGGLTAIGNTAVNNSGGAIFFLRPCRRHTRC